MKVRLTFLIVLCSCALIFVLEAKTLDPYKVLGVDRKASQREIQKAFHKLSLQYHPDKNKHKGAQEKFAEINNAYDILSDEEKRKNYDLYGDEKGNPGFDPRHTENQGGYAHFTTGGPGSGGFTFGPDDWQNMGGHGYSKYFSFSFGGQGGRSSSGIGIEDIFSDFFAMGGGSKTGSFGSSTRSQSSRGAPKSMRAVNIQIYKKEISDKGMAWLLLSYTQTMMATENYESIIQEVANSLQGALEIGSIDCQTELSLCKDLGLYSGREPKIFIYSYRASEGGSFVEYNGDLSVKNLKTFCQEHLPRFSKRVDLNNFEFPSGNMKTIPKVMLLSTKKGTPVIWRVLSGLYHKQFAFYDAEVHDASDPMVRKLGVDALPSVVGWLSNGEKHILSTGISVKDIKSAVRDLSSLLDSFDKKNRKAASSQAKKANNEPEDKQIPVLARSNFETICGETTPVCIIGAFRSSKGKENMEKILLSVSQKSLLRQRNSVSGSRDSISYALLDASKQSLFFKSFDKSGFKSSDKLLVAYKPRKGKFAAYTGELTAQQVESFIGSVLNGDVQFTKAWQKPTLK